MLLFVCLFVYQKKSLCFSSNCFKDFFNFCFSFFLVTTRQKFSVVRWLPKCNACRFVYYLFVFVGFQSFFSFQQGFFSSQFTWWLDDIIINYVIHQVFIHLAICFSFFLNEGFLAESHTAHILLKINQLLSLTCNTISPPSMLVHEM